MSGTIQIYQRDTGTGRLTLKDGTTTGLLYAGDPHLAISPDGGNLYAAGRTGLIEENIDPVTGLLTYLQTAATQPLADVVASPTTSVFTNQYVVASEPSANDVRVYLRKTDGTLSFVRTSFEFQPTALVFAPDGRHLFATSTQAERGIFVFGVDAGGGVNNLNYSYDASLFGGSSPSSLSVSPDGKYLYAVVPGGATTYVLSIDSTTGALTVVSSSQPGLQGRRPWSPPETANRYTKCNPPPPAPMAPWWLTTATPPTAR